MLSSNIVVSNLVFIYNGSIVSIYSILVIKSIGLLALGLEMDDTIHFNKHERDNHDNFRVFWRSYNSDVNVAKDASISSFQFLDPWFEFGCSKY